MAQLQMADMLNPAIMGAISSGGEIVELNRLATKATTGAADNILFDNAGAVTDVVVGGLAIVNHLLPQPVVRGGSLAGAGAGITLITRRGALMLGQMLLGLNRTVTKAPAARHLRQPNANGALPAYAPAAALEVAPITRKRQFFSVT